MTYFKEWLLCEGIKVSLGNPTLQPFLGQARQALTTYLNRYGGPELKFTAARYHYNLEKVDDDYWQYTKFTFSYLPIEKTRGQEMIAAPDDWRYSYEKALGRDWDGKTGKRQYRTPKDAIEEIPTDPSLAYRGISWEEWQSIRKTGVIQSSGGYNLKGQEGLTFWGTAPETGVSYAGGFSPVPFKATPTKPGVIIAFPKNILLNFETHPDIPASELAHKGPLPASHIVSSWMLVAIRGGTGSLDLMVYKDEPNKVREGSSSHPSISYAIRKMS